MKTPSPHTPLVVLLLLAACAPPEPSPVAPEPGPASESTQQALEAVVNVLPSNPTTPAPLPSMTTTSIGRIPGALAVTSRGAAVYSVKIEVPAGRRGLQPQLELEYDSQKKNGIAGSGWSLTGVWSMITPCGRDLTQPEGYVQAVRWSPSDDLFCLDGAPLVLVNGSTPSLLYGDSGAEYRTERDSFRKVVQNGRPATSFTVYTKDGRILTYGGADGRMAARNGKLRAWVLSEISDRFGSSMTIAWTRYSSSYLEDYNRDTFEDYTGAPEAMEFMPSSISYGGGGPQAHSRQVTFSYATRPDRERGWEAGIRFERTRRLTAIRTYVDGRRVRSYNLAYTTSASTRNSLLASLEECAGTGDAVCKPKTTFEYSAGQEGYEAAQATQITAPPMGLPPGGIFPATALPIYAMDVDDDGKTDLVYPKGPANAVANTGAYTWRILKMGSQGMANATEIDTGVGASWPFAGVPLDYNQDGKMDLLLLDLATFWRALISTGSGFTFTNINVGKNQTFIGTGDDSVENFTRFTRAADLNGDGAPDLLSCEQLDDKFRWSYRFHTGTGFGSINRVGLGVAGTSDCRTEARSALMIDTDGDGATELVFATPANANYQAVFFNKPPALPLRVANTHLPSSVPGTWSQNRLRLMDVNHDGLVDIVTGMSVPGSPTISPTIRYWLNLGDRFAGGLHGYQAYADDYGQYSGALVTSVLIDDDGDGSHDLLLAGDPSSMTGCGGSGQPACPPARTGDLEILRNDLTDTWPPAPKLSRYDTGIGPYCYFGRGFSRPHVLDENGDLLPDLVFIDTTSGGHSQQDPCWSHPAQFMYARHRSGQPDLLVKIRDGQAGVLPSSSQWSNVYTARIDYSPSTSTTVYQDVLPGETRAACAYPVSCAHPRMTLVRDVYEDRGEGIALAHTSFDYYDARVNLTGRGFLGFGQRRIRDYVSGAVTTLRYDNVTSVPVDASSSSKVRRYPFAGALLESKRDVTNAAGVHVVTTTSYRHAQLAGPVIYPYASYAIFSSFADREEKVVVEGTTELSRVVKTFARDLFGNETCETTDYSGSGATCTNDPTPQAGHNWTRVTRTWKNDAATWLIGLEQERVTRGVAGTKVGTQRTKWEHSATTGAVQSRTVDPDLPSQRLETKYGLDAHGNVRVETVSSSRESRETVFTRDSEGIFVSEVKNPLGHVTRMSFDRALGVPVTTVDENGLVTQFQHDGLGRLRRVTRPDGVVTQLDYVRTELSDGRYTFSRVTDTSGGEHKAELLDRLGRVVRTDTVGLGGTAVQVATRWHQNGRLAARSLPGFGGPSSSEVRYTYDNLERLIRTTHADGTFSRIEYTGLDIDTYDEAGVRTRRAYKERGQTKRVDAPATGLLTYTYGPFGEIASITNELGHVTRIESDNHARPTQVEDPSAGVRKLRYDAFGQLIEQTDGSGVVMSFTYDKLGRLSGRTDSEGGVTFTWDASPKGIGKIASTRRGTSPAVHEEKYTYDALSRLARVDTFIAEAEPGTALQFARTLEYDASGNVATEKWLTPETSFAIGYTYDAEGNLQALKDASAGVELWRAVEANPAGQLTKEQVLSGYETVRKYHPTRGWVTGIDTKPIQALEYVHDARGNVVRRVDRVAKIAQRFDYNSEQELEQVWICLSDLAGCPTGETLQRKYAYDSIGNMVWDNELGDHTYDTSRPQLMVKAAGEVYEYDKNGYTTKLRGKQLEYTSFGKLKRVTSGSAVTQLRYDARDGRALKIDADSRTAYVGPLQRRRAGSDLTTQLEVRAYGRVVAAITASGAAKPVYSFFHSDNLGSANVTSRLSGTTPSLEPQVAFDPFGQAQAATWGSAYAASIAAPMESAGFTGHDHDAELGLVDMKGRIYDPKTARFLTPDPIVRAPFKRQDLNRYSYAWNNPLKVTDPTGYTEDWDQEQSYDDYDDLDEGDMSMEQGPDSEVSYDENGAQHHSFDEAYVDGQTSMYGSPTDQSVAPSAPEGPNPDQFPDDWNLDDDENGMSMACLVEMCSRAADLPGGKFMAKLELYHRWIRTPNMEVGMGKEGGGVPGREVNTDTMKTTMNDHKGEGDKPGSVCVPICGVSVEEVEGRIREGTPTGSWVPLMNDCNNVVEDALVQSGADPKEVEMPLHPDFLRDFYLSNASE